MKCVYASRTGNVESIMQTLGLNALRIDNGNEIIDDCFILFTYTDGYGDVPLEVENFLLANSHYLKGVIVSGDMGYGETYCQAGDKIAESYDVPCLYKVESAGTSVDYDNIKKIIG